ncbi:hypothetical protein COB52_00685 [Candidatus Kaiserbacteria bacterium]|nr:MAG: hypothetical protein COB52_00685 [Candidatus Kaiserbacteria bacterium]
MRQTLLKLALAVFVIVTLSAVGGVIRGGKVAVDSMSQTATSLSEDVLKALEDTRTTSEDSYWEAGDGMIPGVYKKPSSHAGTQSVVWFGNGDQLSYFSDSNKYFVLNGRTGEYIPAEGQYLDSIKKTINTEYLEGGMKQASKSTVAEEVPLVVSKESNRCSTTYVTNGGEVDCYNKGDDEASRAIRALATCIAGNTKGVDPASLNAVTLYEKMVPQLNKGMCMGEEAKIVKTPSGQNAVLSTKPLVIYPIVTPPIPSACKKEYDVVIGIMGGLNGSTEARKTASTATLDDIKTCAWKGAVVCFSSVGSKTLTCKKKADIAIKNITSAGPVTPPPSTQTGCSGNAAKKIQCYIQGVLKDPNKRKSIAKGFLDGLKNVFSKKKGGSSNIPEPQCLIEASKSGIKEGESVSIRWKTANTTSVSIEGITGDVSKTGLKVVSPTQTTTYKLIAIGGGDKRKECQTTVEVTKTNEGPVGAYPPTLSCLPKLIKKEEPAVIEWACPPEADGSEGVGIDTNNELTGSVSISPENNSNYSVKCLLEGEEIGRNTCAVSVGNPLYDIISYPSSVKEGERVKITWASLFMTSCRVEGPRGFDYTSSHGVVITEPFEVGASGSISSANYDLSCRTQFGDLVSKKVEVGLDN